LTGAPCAPATWFSRTVALAADASPPAMSKRAAIRQHRVRPWSKLLDSLEAGSGPSCVVVLCGINPGNLGAILRNCALLGIAVVCVLESLSGADITRALRTSQLPKRPHWEVALVPVPEDVTPATALKQLREAGLTLVGLAAETACRDCRPIWEADLALPGIALVFGADRDDGRAFPEGVAETLDAVVAVPMRSADAADTMNVSHVASIVAYERQRQQGSSVGSQASVSRASSRRFPFGMIAKRGLLSFWRSLRDMAPHRNKMT